MSHRFLVVALVTSLCSLTAYAQAGDEFEPYPEQQYDEPQYAEPQYTEDGQYIDEDGQQYAPPDVNAEPVELTTVASVRDFEPTLAPYGDWVNANGVRAWRPSPAVVGTNFTPYVSSGQWVSTEAGWSFSSTLPFGWATFHYGRWWYDPSFGWVWVPDTTWGPSWVEWRYGGGYAGWAPLAPPMFARYYRPRYYFVPTTHLCAREVWRHGVMPDRYNSVFSVTVGMPIRSYRGHTWHVGPSWHEVARVSVVPPIRRSMVTFRQPTHVAVPPRPMGALPPPPAARPYNGYNTGIVPPPRGSAVPPPSTSSAPPPARAPMPGNAAPPPTYSPPPPSRAPMPGGIGAGSPPPPSRAPMPGGIGAGSPPPPSRAPMPGGIRGSSPPPSAPPARSPAPLPGGIGHGSSPPPTHGGGHRH